MTDRSHSILEQKFALTRGQKQVLFYAKVVFFLLLKITDPMLRLPFVND